MTTPTLLITTVRQALDMPMLSEGKCLSVARAVLMASRDDVLDNVRPELHREIAYAIHLVCTELEIGGKPDREEPSPFLLPADASGSNVAVLTDRAKLIAGIRSDLRRRLKHAVMVYSAVEQAEILREASYALLSTLKTEAGS